MASLFDKMFISSRLHWVAYWGRQLFLRLSLFNDAADERERREMQILGATFKKNIQVDLLDINCEHVDCI